MFGLQKTRTLAVTFLVFRSLKKSHSVGWHEQSRLFFCDEKQLKARRAVSISVLPSIRYLPRSLDIKQSICFKACIARIRNLFEIRLFHDTKCIPMLLGLRYNVQYTDML